MKNLTQKWTQSGLSFPKSRHFFRFSKRAGEVSPLHPSCTATYSSHLLYEFIFFMHASCSFRDLVKQTVKNFNMYQRFEGVTMM